MMERLGEWLFFYLVFPGATFIVALGLAMSWVDRKVGALVQWRKGPPPGQPFWDVVKLLGKEVVVPEQAWGGYLVLPFVGCAAAVLASTLVWHAALGLPGGALGDLIVVFYLLSIPGLAIVLGGAASGNPLGAVGASREMKLVLGYELPLLIALLVAVFQQRAVGGQEVAAATLSLAGLVRFQELAGAVLYRPSGVLACLVAVVCCQAKLGLVPFDQPEADTEIAEGALIEYGGPPLAMFKLTQAVQLATLPVLLVTVFWGGVARTGGGVAAFLAKVLLLLVLVILVRNTNPRVRIDQALRFFWGPATVVAIVALVLAGMGW